MPPIRNISITNGVLTFTDHRGVPKTFNAETAIPKNWTIAQAETFANNWAAANVGGYQIRVHIFSLTPLVYTVGTWNAGLTIPDNWWSL